MASIREWLDSHNLGKYAEAFEENEIAWDVLRQLDADTLKDIGVRAAGDRLRILNAIRSLSLPQDDAEAPVQPAPSPEHSTPGEAERRQLTVVFCDLADSTGMAQRLDPEQLRELIGAYQMICRLAIERYDGFVARYVGDGVLAYFGYPQAHEEDAERAVRAALAIVEQMNELNERAANRETELSVRVGIETGPVVVGDLIGEGTSQERVAIGATLNLASRLQGIAGRNSVVIGPGTRPLTQDYFKYQDLGEHQLKGFTEPVRAWRVLGEHAIEGRFEARHPSGATALVGREEELSLILRRWSWVKEGEGQVILLSGEPGIGKSRILQEIRQRLAYQDSVFLRYQCSPYHGSTALWPFIEQLQRAASIEPAERPEEKLDKLEALLALSTDEVDVAMPYIAQLLSVETGDRYPASTLTAPEQKERTLELLTSQLTGLAQQQTVVVLFEDAHWSDPTSLELLNRLIQHIANLPVLLVLTFRPEFDPPWTGFAHVTGLTLNRMGRRETQSLVAHLTDGRSLPDEVMRQVFERTDGVPLFVEEITRFVLDSGALAEHSGRYVLTVPLAHLGIPETLNASLMARLDRLAPARETAQVAAVIGREFTYELLADVSPLSGRELQDALSQMAAAGLIFCRGEPPNASYTFKHALVRDAAYESLLNSRRHALHGAIAYNLERRHASNLDGVCNTLAHHYSEADQPDKAVEFLVHSASKAAEKYAHREAIKSLSQALEQHRRSDSLPRDALAEIRLRLAQSHYFVGEFHESMAILADEENQEGIAAAPTLAAEWFFWLGHMCVRSGDPDAARKAARRAIEEGELAGSPAAQGKAYGVLVIQGHLGDDIDVIEASAGNARRSVSLLEQAGEPYWQGMTEFYLGMVYVMRAEFDDALATAARAYELGEGIGDKRLKAYGRFLRGWVRAAQGQCDEAVRDCQEALDMAPDATSRSYASCFLGYSYLEAGRYDLATPLLRKAVEDFQLFRFVPFEGWFRALLAESLRCQDETEEASRLAASALDVCRQSRYAYGQGWAQRCLGRIEMQKQRSDKAGVQLRAAARTFERIGGRYEQSRTLKDLAPR